MANYYIAINNQRRGPFPEEELFQNGMTPDSLVWCKGMEGWTRASDVPELAKYLASQEPPELPQLPDVPQYAPQYAQGQYQQTDDDFIPFPPDSHLSGAILSTIFCCPPLGIVAIVKAAKVNSLYHRGRYDEAERMSDSASRWVNATVIAGIVFNLLYFLLVFMA